jgi:hypothetical protein
LYWAFEWGERLTGEPEYRPLDVATHEIRLVVLQPREGDLIVEFEIIHAYLKDNPI